VGWLGQDFASPGLYEGKWTSVTSCRILGPILIAQRITCCTQLAQFFCRESGLQTSIPCLCYLLSRLQSFQNLNGKDSCLLSPMIKTKLPFAFSPFFFWRVLVERVLLSPSVSPGVALRMLNLNFCRQGPVSHYGKGWNDPRLLLVFAPSCYGSAPCIPLGCLLPLDDLLVWSLPLLPTLAGNLLMLTNVPTSEA
jgi:hypothetical protein